MQNDVGTKAFAPEPLTIESVLQQALLALPNHEEAALLEQTKRDGFTVINYVNIRVIQKLLKQVIHKLVSKEDQEAQAVMHILEIIKGPWILKPSVDEGVTQLYHTNNSISDNIRFPLMDLMTRVLLFLKFEKHQFGFSSLRSPYSSIYSVLYLRIRKESLEQIIRALGLIIEKNV